MITVYEVVLELTCCAEESQGRGFSVLSADRRMKYFPQGKIIQVSWIILYIIYGDLSILYP